MKIKPYSPEFPVTVQSISLGRVAPYGIGEIVDEFSAENYYQLSGFLINNRNNKLIDKKSGKRILISGDEIEICED